MAKDLEMRDTDFGKVELTAIELLATRSIWCVKPSVYAYEWTKQDLAAKYLKSEDCHRYFSGTLHEGDAEKFPNYREINKINKFRYKISPPTRLADRNFGRVLEQRRAHLAAQGIDIGDEALYIPKVSHIVAKTSKRDQGDSIGPEANNQPANIAGEFVEVPVEDDQRKRGRRKTKDA